MNDWTAGYVADIGYTYGYYTELNPERIKLAFLNAGLVSPEVGVACELGFGQGISANIHAASSPTEWHGTDFNPSQAGFAQDLAAASGAGARLYDEAFTEFVGRKDLPDFDYIGLHGIWSWISDDNRRVIVDFVRRKLKVGGVLYVSYNTLPGWASFGPMRHLMTEHAEVLGSEGRGIVSRIDGAIEFVAKLLEIDPLYSRANPYVADRLKKMKGLDRQYLAHEYFNRDWHPMHFSSMAKWLSEAKVQYACSAHYLDHVDALNLTVEQQVFLKEIPDPMFREATRDFIVNQTFRRDYWVKGARKITALARAEAIRHQKVVLTSARPDVALTVKGSQAEVELSESVYNPILNYLGDYKPHTLFQVEQSVKEYGISFNQVIEAAMILGGSGHLATVQEESVIAKSRKRTDSLNIRLCENARFGNDIAYLASPVTGGGIPAHRFKQLFITCLLQGKKDPVDWANAVWQLVAMQGQKLVKEGKALETAEENLVELTAQARDFSEKQLPLFKALQIV